MPSTLITWKGTYSSSIYYVPGDAVTLMTSSYLNTRECMGVEPSNLAFWSPIPTTYNAANEAPDVPPPIAQGPMGPSGEKGDKGDKGDAGPQGIQGIQGIKGDTGLKGDKGDTGLQGLQGQQGIKGDTGLKGDKGDTGLTGPSGSGQNYSGTWDDPTGNVSVVDPTLPAIYYKRQASPVVMWLWNNDANPANRAWFVVMS